MSAETKAKIRDRRKAGWFRIDDELIEVYGPEIGVHGIAVYAALCKHADKEESSHPGLRLLCEKLKIGRAKLLKTLAKLEAVGLISIEPGDRNNVNVYTLLDVPKGGSNENQGGSNENHEVVLTRTRGGSEQHQGGGSSQNRNQISTEPDPLNQSSRATPDDTTTKCLQLLLQVKDFPRDQGQNALNLAKYRYEFPSVDPVEVCQDFAAYASEKPFRKGDKPRLRLRNFFKQAAKSRKPSKTPPPEAPAINGKAAEDRRKEGYEWLFGETG